MRVARAGFILLALLILLASSPSRGFLVNYQAANLGLLPNGYNVAASNLAANQPQQQDSSQYLNQNEQPGNQQRSQDQYPPQEPTTHQNAANHMMHQYPARNNLQQQQSSGISERETQSSPIFRLQGSALNSTAVKLVWSLESGYMARSFEIKYGPIPNHEVYSLNLNGSARDITIGSLQPDTLYQFTLLGYPGEGSAGIWRPRIFPIKTPKFNDQSSQAMRQIVEDGQITPLGVKAEAKSHQTIQLTWTEQERPVNVQNLKRVNIIRYYIVNETQTNASQQQQQSSSTADQTNSSLPTTASIKYNYLNVSEDKIRGNGVVIQKLQPATEYAFAVKTAYVGPDMKKIYRHSGFSMDTSAKTFDLEPSPPKNFTIQTASLRLARNESDANREVTIQLTWSAPDAPNGRLRGYVILWSQRLDSTDEKWRRIQVDDPTVNDWYLSDFEPSKTYYFKMRAVNQRGQSADTETLKFTAPPKEANSERSPPPIPPNNILMMIVLCLILVLFVLFLVVSLLFCRNRSSSNKGSRRKGLLRSDRSELEQNGQNGLHHQSGAHQSSTVAGRVGTLARRSRLQQGDHLNGVNGKPDFWISAVDQQQALAAANNSAEIKSQMSEKSGSDINMAAMVSIQRDSPQQFTTQTAQLAPMLPEYRFTSSGAAQQQHLAAATEHQLLQQMQQQQSHYHTGNQFASALAFDQMDNATASALMTLSKRQQQQLQKYQIQFAGGAGGPPNQPPSPHQQPPPPPPLNIEQQQQQQPLYGTHHQAGGPHQLTNTRSLRVHRPTLYDPVSGSFVQQDTPPNYNSHLNSMLNGVHHQLRSFNNQSNGNHAATSGSNTLQFHHHPHQTSTLMSRRSTNTMRSFQSTGGSALYGQLGGQFAAPPVPPTSGAGGQPHLLQNHQAVINQLNQASYPSLPLKHVSTVRPQIMSSLEDQIEMELAEKQAEQQHQQSQQQQQQQQQHQQGPPSSMQQEQQT